MGKKQQEIVVSMPLYIITGVKKKKKNYINLNQYRNWHFQLSNKLKIAYKDIAYPQIKDLSFQKISLSFILYKGSNRKLDRSNVLSIHEKFFCDALVESGCMPDDNDDYIVSTQYSTGGIDKNNPRVDIVITILQ